MRQMRARSWCLRDGFADVLRGLYVAEEAADMTPPKDMTPPPAPPSPAIAAPAAPSREAEDAEVVTEAVAETEPEPIAELPAAESTKLKSQLIRRLHGCKTTAEIEKWAADTNLAALRPADRGEVQDEYEAMAAELFEREQAAG
jgi:hypothetical protein